MFLMRAIANFTGTSVEAISEERASRSLYRIQLLSKIREEVEY